MLSSDQRHGIAEAGILKIPFFKKSLIAAKSLSLCSVHSKNVGTCIFPFFFYNKGS